MSGEFTKNFNAILNSIEQQQKIDNSDLLPIETNKSNDNTVNKSNDNTVNKSNDSNTTDDIQDYIDTISAFETNSHDYNAVNKKTGAYGRYQFMPETLKEFARKSGQTIEQAKTPAGQDKMMIAWMKENKRRLEQRGIKATKLNMWIAHNQGIGGATQILKNKPSLRLIKAISYNLPSGYEPTIENYKSYWENRINELNGKPKTKAKVASNTTDNSTFDPNAFMKELDAYFSKPENS